MITFIYFKNRTGKVRTLTTTSRSLSLLVLTFFMLILCSGGFGFFTSKYYYENMTLKEDLLALSTEKKALEMQLLGAENRHMLTVIQEGIETSEDSFPAEKNEERADDKIPQLTTKAKFFSAGNSKSSTPNEHLDEPSFSSTAGLSSESKVEYANHQAVIIENLVAEKLSGDRGVKVRFNVAKNIADREKASGYVILIWRAGGRYNTYPKTVGIMNGLPLNYKRGDNFIIKYRRPFTMTITDKVETIEEIFIFVYDDKGKVVIKKEIDMERALS